MRSEPGDLIDKGNLTSDLDLKEEYSEFSGEEDQECNLEELHVAWGSTEVANE